MVSFGGRSGLPWKSANVLPKSTSAVVNWSPSRYGPRESASTTCAIPSSVDDQPVVLFVVVKPSALPTNAGSITPA